MDEASLAANPGEYLDPGYDPQTPDDDNLLLSFMRAERELWRSWGECVDAEIGGDDDAGVFWVDSGSASVFGNPVLWARPVDAAAAPALVGRQKAAFSSRSGGPYLLYSAFPTPDLAQHGLQAVGHPPCMVRLPAPMPERPSAGVLAVRRVGSDRELDDFERTFLEAYPVPDLMPWQPRGFMGERLLDDRRWHLFVGYVDGAPVTTSAAFVTDNVVDVTLVACQPDARGRGYGRAMTEAAAGADSTKPAILLASDDGQPVYRAMGFHSMMRYSIWIGPRGEGPA